jgi:ferritin-like metal-binding protein YciE
MAHSDLQQQLINYLQDVHSLEQNAIAQLETGASQAGYGPLREAFQQHLEETREQERLVKERLESYGEGTSTLKDVAQKGGALLSGTMAKVAPDTTGKLAIQAYAFEHLEIASYRMLAVVAERAGDHETLTVVNGILEQEQATAQTLESLLEQVSDYDLRELGVAA